MSEEVIDLESNNLCITEDVFEKFQVNSMYEEEEIITLPNTSTTAYNVVSDTDSASSVNNIPLITNDQIINIDLEEGLQAKEQSESQFILQNIDSGDDLQIQEEICVQTTNDDGEPQHLQTTSDGVKSPQVQIINDDVETLHVQTSNDNVQVQHVQTTNDVESQHQTTNDDYDPQQQITNDNVKPHVQGTNELVEYVPTTDEHFESQHVPTINDNELQFVELTNQSEQPMEVDSQIVGSEMSVNLESQVDSNTVGDPPTSSSKEFNNSTPTEQNILKKPKKRGRKKKISQDVNEMSIEDKMNLIHGTSIQDTGTGQSTGNNLDSMNFTTPRQQRRRGRKKNSIQDSKIDTSTDSELISNKNVCNQQENDLVSSGTQLELQSFNNIIINNEPKKRGRKKKNVQLQSSLDGSTESQLNSNGGKTIVQYSEKAPITKSKRGRKPKNVQYSDKSLLDDSEYSIEHQLSDSPRINKAMSSSDVEGYITSQKSGSQNNVSEEQLISLSDLELNSENSATEQDMPLSQLSKRRGRPRKICHEETVKEIKQPKEIESSSCLTKAKIDAEFPSPSKEYPVKRKRGRPKRKIIEEVDSSDKINESGAQTEMPSSTSVETVKSNVSNEREPLLDGDDIDDICLSNLRKSLDTKSNEIDNVPVINENETEMISSDIKVTTTKRSSKMPVMADFEYNIDNIMNDPESVEKSNIALVEEGKSAQPIEKDKIEIDESLLVEDSSRRPTRRRIKQNLHYDEESDEDPFANVELSDDDEPRGKKGGRYYSDDEYVPHRKEGKRKNTRNTTDSSSNTECEIEEESKKQKRKRSYSRKDVSLSPRKKGRINIVDNVEENISVTVPPKDEALIEGDIEVCLESSVIKTSEISVVISPATNEDATEDPTWGTTNEFENFIAKKIQGTALKIKKVSSDQSSVTIPPIDIPTMDAKDIKKTVEMCTQTSVVHTKTSAVQTSSHDDVPMKENVTLSKDQSLKACEFLNGIVKTTAELGVLMTQKSEDFMKKKINTTHVTDTFKMDYCVKKSFLLFKLAKRNLMQMEEDLANQYEQFLKTNKLDNYREEVKTISSKAKADSDSDCEIIEETISKVPVQVKKKTPKFNPKTVFLNKELSIKIAKKPTDDKKLNIKGKHSVWINDSVILKKVKPTQSFLAQDSRNKKPPDNIFTKIVNDFFHSYNRQKALSVCAPFVTTEWLFGSGNFVCNYFVAKSDDFPTQTNFSESQGHFLDSSDNRTSTSDSNVHSTINQLKSVNTAVKSSSPKTLFSLCTTSIQNQLCLKSATDTDSSEMLTEFQQKDNIEPEPLFRLCVNILNSSLKGMESHNDSESTFSLKTMSYMDNDLKSPLSLDSMLDMDNNLDSPLSMKTISYMDNDLKNPNSLQTISYKKVLELFRPEDRPLEVLANNAIADTFGSKLPLIDDVYTSNQVTFYNKEKSNLNGLTENGLFKESYKIRTLFSLCVEFIQRQQIGNFNVCKHVTPMSLKYIAYKKIIDCMHGSRAGDHDLNKYIVNDLTTMTKMTSLITADFDKSPKECSKNEQLTMMTAKSLTIGDFDNNPRNYLVVDQSTVIKVKTLSNICIEKIVSLQSKTISSRESQSLTINSVNTMSEEAFLNIEQTSQLENRYFDDSDDDFEPEYDFEESVHNTVSDDSNWATQLQLGELKSGIISTLSNNADKNIQNESNIYPPCDIPAMVHIKCEPQDEFLTNSVDPSIVKSEVNYDELVITLENVTTKAEKECPVAKDPIQRHDSTSYDVDAFESFVSSNKMILGTTEEIFSQSALRVHRQHEPDFDNEYDLNMSLLVPHTSVPLPVDNAKTTLMESSSEDNNNKEILTKKKIDKRKKRTKKAEVKPNNKDTSNITKNKSVLTNEKLTFNNEVAVLTRRMRDRIRQEEKKIESSDSDTETRSLRSKSDKKKGEQTINTKANKSIEHCGEKEIQCNNVDSTEQISENIDKSVIIQQDLPDEAFTGFSVIDQNAISDYQKCIQDVYNKILPKVDSPVRYDELQTSSFNTEDAVEYLECEPTLPIFDNEVKKRSSKKKALPKRKLEIINNPNDSKISEEVNTPRKLTESEIINELRKPEESEIINELDKLEESYIVKDLKLKDINTPSQADIAEMSIPDTKPFVDRYGWHCYPIASNDSRIYEHCQIKLDKLPESFVEMYFRYQDVTEQSKEDEEVDRLINLQSLNRLTFTKDNLKSKVKVKVKTEPVDTTEPDFSDGSRAASPTSDNCNELTASEDEQQPNDVELLRSAPVQTSENILAKDSLMNDNETDTDPAPNQVVEGVTDKESIEKPVAVAPKRRRPGPKSKCKLEEPKAEPEPNTDLMLTADKSMKEELTLLHAPMVLQDTIKTPQNKMRTRCKQKSTTKNESERSQIKAEDDSSSEEEKQWVTTKEKLLKRLEKRQETANADDAKRAKVVSEFIERREGAVPRPKKTRRRSRKMTRKFLERQKQLSVLSKELFGESSDGVYAGKRSVTSYSKGRRNIRKVLDKKSLGRNTVLANMEEFERKRRLNIRQCRLRELLGCEEGVNVLVINDELCLEYDFDEQQPVVTVHPYFTKIMKAHQYEGVKFMWDACFESLAHIAAGHPGGGCILAHCMGLGKTLQVLALLHTVMTHPGVGMHRVLVCCPLSTVLNWVDEIHKWIGPVTNQMKVFELSKLKKTYERAYQLEDWYNGGGIFIIGYELFRSLTTLDPFLDDVRPTIINKIRTALLDPGPDIIICDEGHLLKNDLSVLAVAMSRVATKRRIVLTGTPMQNNLREYYCMVNFVKPNLLGTYAEYSNRFENPIMNGQHRDSSEEDIKLMKARTHILHKVLEGCLQRMEASVLYPYLPKKYEYTVFISLTKCQWDLYKHYLTVYGNKNKQSILKDFHQLQKIWSHPQVLHNFQTRVRDQNAAKVKEEKLEDDLASEELAASVGPDVKPPDTEVWWLPYLEGGAMLDSLDSSNKFVVVFRILDECIKLGDKVLIFSTSLFTMDVLEYFLRKINKWSLGQEYFRLDGSVPAEVRQKWCREFNAENNLKTKLFLISTRAGCLGLNMTAANRVIILDTSWNPAHDIQSIFRVYRFGQKKDCYIYRLVALGTMEQKIYERSVTKQAVSCRVVDEQQIDRHYNMAELTELYRFDEEGSGVQSGVAAGVRDVALLRVARLSAMHAVHEHDSLLRGSEPALPEHERQAAWVQFQFQQEHEHMQMQNELVGNVTKRPYARVAKLSNVKMLKMEANTQDPDFKPEPKKRGRKPRAQVQEANGAPELIPKQEDYNMDPEIEQEKIKKIAEILIKFNFQDIQMQTMLPQLVMNVRRMVATGQRNGSMQCDELTASIANILLEKTDINMPTVTDIMCKSVNKSITEQQPEQPLSTPLEDTAEKNVQPVGQHVEQPVAPPFDQPIEQPVAQPPVKKYKPGPKCRKGYVYEEIPVTTVSPPAESEYDVRAKRRAALAAERLLETANKSVVDDDMCDNDSDTVSIPESMLQNLTSKQVLESKSRVSERLQTLQIQTPTVEKLSKKLRVRRLEKQPDNTIMLSDDEEPVSKKAVAVEKSSEPIPLHPSLLQNANFIKIVAHTYLAGNPMLDEDAATLAARYSTYKALKELESTGKPIAGGPIYDIAVKVLGIDILEKLHNTDTKLGAHSSLMLPSQQLVGKPPVENTSKITPKTRKSGRGASKAAKADLPSASPPTVAPTRTVPSTMPQLAAAPGQVQSNVVPVGLFKTTLSMPTGGPKREAVEESILPDDDVHIVSSPPLAPPSPSPPATRRNAKPIIIRAIRAGRSDPTKDLPITSQVTTALTPTALAAPGPVAPDPPPQHDYSTICLDSDDEDTAALASTLVGTWYAPPNSLSTPTSTSNVPTTITATTMPAIFRSAPKQPGPASKTAMTLTGDPATIILTKNYGRAPPPLSDTINQTVQATASPGSSRMMAKPTRLFMIPSSSVANMNPPLIPISVAMPTAGQPQISHSPLQHLYQHSILPDTLGLIDNAESILPTPTSNLPTPNSILPTPTSILPTPTSTLPTPTTILPTPTYGAPTATPVPPIGPKKKSYKSHDVIRIGKSGQVELISRSGEIELIELPETASKTPEFLKIAPKPASKITETPKPIPRPPDIPKVLPKTASTKTELPKIAPKPAAKTTDIPKAIPKLSSRSTRLSQVKENEMVKKPSTSNACKLAAVASAPTSRTRRVSTGSSGESRPATPHDPLAILKDVIHIQADEYSIEPSKPVTTSIASNRKCFALAEGTTTSSSVMSPSSTASVKLQPTKNTTPRPSNTITKKKLEVGKSRGFNELVVDSVDLTESCSSTQTNFLKGEPTSSAVKKSNLKLKKPISTLLASAPLPSTSKNTASASKIIRVKTEKGGGPKAGPKCWSDSKKRATASVDSNPAKKKKLDQLMTLEDFDIDDIDDIIELD